MKKVPDSYVIDASVVAKWYLNDENLIDKAEDFLVRLLANEIILHAPEILRYELGHLLISAKRQS
jgi:predicted nucleic acid-binding protein